MSASHGPTGETARPEPVVVMAAETPSGRTHASGDGRKVALALLAIAFALAFAQRSCQTRHAVFTDKGTAFQGIDAWYHARLIEYEAVRGLGSAARLQVDPYLAMPEGGPILVGPLFDEMAGLLARVALGGRTADPQRPSDLETVRRAAAWLPVLLGSALVVPIYLLAARLWGGTAGWISLTCYLAVPGALLDRSVLGATDHHVAETLFAVCALVCLTFAIESTGRASRLFAILAGCALAAYQMTWIAGVLLPLVLGAWLVSVLLLAAITTVRAPLGIRMRDLRRLVDTLTATAWCTGVAWGLLVLRADGVRIRWLGVHTTAALFVLACLAILPLRRWIRNPQPMPRFGWTLAAIFVAVLGAGCIWMLRSDALGSYLVFLRERPGANTVSEASRLLSSGRGWVPIWREFGMGWLVAMPGMVLLAWRAFCSRSPSQLLIVVWTATAVLLTFAQVRFAYYLAPITAWAAALLVATLVRVDTPASDSRRIRAARLLAVLGVLAVFVAPNARMTQMRMSSVPLLRSGWQEALAWLRLETPDPFSGRDCFHGADPPRDPACRPDYGVFTWWDYGYWVIQEGRRVPFTNPTQHRAGEVARLLLSEPQLALPEARTQNARYLIVDAMLTILQTQSGLHVGKFTALPIWAGLDSHRYLEPVVIVEEDGRRRGVYLFKEAYFRSLVGRLIANGVEANVARRIPVVEVVDDGLGLRTVRAVRVFDDEAEAGRFLVDKDPSSWMVGSFDSLQNPFTLPEIDGLRAVFSSRALVAQTQDRDIPEVQVFEIGPTDPRVERQPASEATPRRWPVPLP